MASEIHCHNTRYDDVVRTTQFGLKVLQIEGAKLWATISTDIKNCQTKSFNSRFKKFMIELLCKYYKIIIISSSSSSICWLCCWYGLLLWGRLLC